jgi:hypothetical protein
MVSSLFYPRDKETAMAARTTRAKRTAVREGDQYLLRLPPGMRERLEQRAAANGRAMAAEVIEAIEKHLTSADRVTQLWETFAKHQENIEAIPVILSAIREIESCLESYTDSPSALYRWEEGKRYNAYVATLPLVTADQVQTIRALLKETGVDEETLLGAMGAPRIEDIKFEPAMKYVGERMRNQPFTADQLETIKALLKEGGGWETFNHATGASYTIRHPSQ